jgi:predicted aspartyl protease
MAFIEQRSRELNMGRFSMKLELANFGDVFLAERGDMSEDEVRRFECEGVVDTGAAHLVIPGDAMDALGVEKVWEAKVRYADNHTQQRPVVKNVWLKLCGRESVFSAVVEPNRKTALIGAIVLEALDLVVDCVTQQLHPRDPHFMVTEIE